MMLVNTEVLVTFETQISFCFPQSNIRLAVQNICKKILKKSFLIICPQMGHRTLRTLQCHVRTRCPIADGGLSSDARELFKQWRRTETRNDVSSAETTAGTGVLARGLSAHLGAWTLARGNTYTCNSKERCLFYFHFFIVVFFRFILG